MQTIAELKQEALDRESKQAVLTQQAAEFEAAKLEKLREMIRAESPLGAFPFELSPWSMGKTSVTFYPEGHARIVACYECDYHGVWSPARIDSDGYSKTMYRVFGFAGTQYDPESETYCPRYAHADFTDLGEALLAAERAFVDPVYIDDEVAEHNAARATRETPAPEPTTEEIFMSSLKDLILEYASQTRDAFA